ncbi:hypothetical protein AKO1_001002, partial [Acrasis kona]
MTKLYSDMGFEQHVIMRVPFDKRDQLRSDKNLEIMWQLSDHSKAVTHIMDEQYCVDLLFDKWDLYTIQEPYLLDNAAGDLLAVIMRRSRGYKNKRYLLPMGCDFTWKRRET